MSFYDYIVVALLGGVIALDKSAFRMLAGEPLVICTAAGAYLGELEIGLMMGMIWQLIWMGELPIGAAVIHDGSTGALVSTCIYIKFVQNSGQLAQLLFALALFIGVVSAYMGGSFISDKRNFHNRYLNIMDKFAKEVRPAGVESVFIVGMAEQFLSGAFFASFLCFIFSTLLNFTLHRVPVYWDSLFCSMAAITMGIASAVIVDLFWNRKTLPPLLLGLALGFVYLVLI